MPSKMTTEQFIAKAKAVHGEKYDYSKVSYINNSTKVTIIDPVYGEFQQTPANHLQGKGHPLGSNDKIKSALKSSKEEFIRKARLVHGNKYDYSKVEYTNNRTKVIIIDPIYGEFEQTPSNHLKGQGHPKEKGKKISDKVKVLDTAQIIERFKKAHPEGGYDYSKVEYHNMDTPVTIICRNLDKDGNEYGEYQQTPRVHIKGCGHPQEAIDKNAVNATISNEEYISRCKALFGDKYDYSECHYTSESEKVKLRCVKHGIFMIRAGNHLYHGKGCPLCGYSVSKSENEIFQHFESIDCINVERRNRSILNGKEIDIYFPDNKLGIEYNGCLWHSEWIGQKEKNYHLNKLNSCNEKGVSLIHIFEDEYVHHKDIVLSIIERILNINNNFQNINANDCVIKPISQSESDVFLEKNHIQGKTSDTINYGAFHNTELITVMSFKNYGNSVYELSRFATGIHYTVNGIENILLDYFINVYRPSQIVSFADRRWIVDLKNNLYTALNFNLESCTDPDYTYFNSKIYKYTRFSKEELPSTDDSLTEEETARKLGYDRIWDCGLAKYVLNLTK